MIPFGASGGYPIVTSQVVLVLEGLFLPGIRTERIDLMGLES